MKKSKGLKAIEKTAAEYGVSVGEIRKEINLAIDAGLSNTDPRVQAHWAGISKNGNRPTPEEVIIYTAKKVKSEQSQ